MSASQYLVTSLDQCASGFLCPSWSFLVRLLKKWDDDLGGSVVLSLCDDFDEPCLVRKWRELENVFGTNFTGQILSECSGDVRQTKAAITYT